jgi:hypothetical protein
MGDLLKRIIMPSTDQELVIEQKDPEVLEDSSGRLRFLRTKL